MAKHMHAAIYKGDGRVEVESVPVPAPVRPTDVLLKVEAASICGSDLHVTNVPPGQYAKPGIALGHEFVGVVAEVGSGVTEFSPGDRVVPDPILNCGKCPACRLGKTNRCRNEDIVGQLRDGGFAQFCIVPEHKLYHFPADIPARVAAQTEPLACVMNGILKLNPMPSERVVIFGAGAIGLTFVRVMHLYGVRDIVVCEMEASRRADAVRCGAALAANPAAEDVAVLLSDRWGDLADIVVDAVGGGKVTEQAIPLLKSGGRLLNFGQDSHARATIPPAEIVRKELTLMGSYSTCQTFPVAIQLQRNPELRLDLLVSHEMPLERIHDALALLRDKQASRIIVYPNGAPAGNAE